MDFFKRRKLRKQLKTLLHHAHTLRASREDLMNAAQLTFLDEHVGRVKAVVDSRDMEFMVKEGEALDACLTKLNPPKPYEWWRENFDVLVVAIGVAMAFRAYFYQPFKIPTGSMQPTLYGIHSEPRPASQATWLDQQPAKFFKWFVTGESFKIIKATHSGTVFIKEIDSGSEPGYTSFVIGKKQPDVWGNQKIVAYGKRYYVPNDVVESFKQGLKGGVKDQQTVKKGDILWSGVIRSGDFLFVNRWKWNFSHPTRGEIMVFSTSGINHLAQGTHYIKRMTGLPGDSIQIKAPNLIINGEAVMEPERIGQIARREKIGDWAPAYAGFNPSLHHEYNIPGKTLVTESDIVLLPPGFYYAMGDNSFNSFDSRYWGPVPERNLLGPASVVHWPFASPRWGWIK
jgi:signal peptidase I